MVQFYLSAAVINKSAEIPTWKGPTLSLPFLVTSFCLFDSLSQSSDLHINYIHPSSETSVTIISTDPPPLPSPPRPEFTAYPPVPGLHLTQLTYFLSRQASMTVLSSHSPCLQLCSCCLRVVGARRSFEDMLQINLRFFGFLCQHVHHSEDTKHDVTSRKTYFQNKVQTELLIQQLL